MCADTSSVRTVDSGAGWAVLVSLAIVVAGMALVPRLHLLAPSGPAAASAIDGQWASHVATTDLCPGGDDAAAAPQEQERTMLCLVNYARARQGLSPVVAAEPLLTSAALKARDIATCGRFDHDPCGRGVWSVVPPVGAGEYAAGENIAMFASETAAPRSVIHGWLNSTGHRENLFRPEWTDQGVALLPATTVDGRSGMNVWVSQFGYRR